MLTTFIFRATHLHRTCFNGNGRTGEEESRTGKLTPSATATDAIDVDEFWYHLAVLSQQWTSLSCRMQFCLVCLYWLVYVINTVLTDACFSRWQCLSKGIPRCSRICRSMAVFERTKHVYHFFAACHWRAYIPLTFWFIFRAPYVYKTDSIPCLFLMRQTPYPIMATFNAWLGT